LLKLLTLKFGEVPEEVARQVAEGDPVELDRWTERMLAAVSLDEVFA
jgi:hypothetical protein